MLLLSSSLLLCWMSYRTSPVFPYWADTSSERCQLLPYHIRCRTPTCSASKLSWHVKIFCHIANKSETSWKQVAVMEFGKRNDTTDTADLCQRQIVTDLLPCCGETDVLDFGLKKSRKHDMKNTIQKKYLSVQIVINYNKNRIERPERQGQREIEKIINN